MCFILIINLIIANRYSQYLTTVKYTYTINYHLTRYISITPHSFELLLLLFTLTYSIVLRVLL